MLVAAVLRPEEREDGELEVVRVAAHQLADTVELPVGEAERAMERLFRDLRQEAIVSGKPDGATGVTLKRWSIAPPAPTCP